MPKHRECEFVDLRLEAFIDDEVKTVPLFEGEVDWAEVVDDIFQYDKIVCWW